MKKHFLLFLFFIFFQSFSLFKLCSVTTNQNFSINNIIVFGDSLSDQGNLFSFLRSFPFMQAIHLSSPPASHDGISFCDGKLLIEYIVDYYHLPLKPAWVNDSPLLFSQQMIPYSPTEKQSIINGYNHFIPFSHNKKIHKSIDELIKIREISSECIKTTSKMKSFFQSRGNNYAVAGATIASDYNDEKHLLTNQFSLKHQIQDYIQYSKRHDISKTFFIIAIGGNDLLHMIQSIISHGMSEKDIVPRCEILAKTIMESISLIQSIGGKKILVMPTLPTVDLPRIHSLSKKNQKIAMTCSIQFSNILKKYREKWNFSQKEVHLIDALSHISNILKTWPKKFRHRPPVHYNLSLSNIDNYIGTREIEIHFHEGFNQSGFDSEQYAFFDDIHPSSATNRHLSVLLIPEIDFFIQE